MVQEMALHSLYPLKQAPCIGVLAMGFDNNYNKNNNTASVCIGDESTVSLFEVKPLEAAEKPKVVHRFSMHVESLFRALVPIASPVLRTETVDS